MVRVLLVAAAAVAAACYRPAPTECAYQCNAESGCPAGLACTNGFCVEPGSNTVCGLATDADPDGLGFDAGNDGGDDPDGPMASRMYTKLAVGSHHACAIDPGGDLWCWGLNDARQLGVTTVDDFSATPLRVPHPMAGGRWTDIAAGAYHTCGLWTPTGQAAQLHCWGQNFSYQTGTTAGGTTTPHQVATPLDHVWKQLALGGAFSCAITEDVPRTLDEIYCWGDNAQNQLASAGAGAMRATPGLIDVSMVTPATDRWRSLTAGTDHACAVSVDGKAWCWGDNGAGQGGRSGGGTSAVALAVGGAFTWTKVGAGDDFSCGIDAATNTLRCWGRNGSRELGNGGTTNTPSPAAVIDTGATAKWKDVSLGLYSSCGIQGPTNSTDAVGTVRCWGDNDFGQRGDSTFNTPTSGPVFGVLDLAFTIDSGHEFACALAGDPVTGGQLYCWGDNADGQIGTGFPSDQRRPVRIGEGVRGTRSWLAVAAGRRHTCAILSGATVDAQELYCWGAGMSGQIDGTVVALPRRAPVRVTHANGATHVVVGSNHTCVRRSVLGVPNVNCWGSDQGYQLGVSGNQEPGPVTTYDNGSAAIVNALVGASNVTCAIGSPPAQCWGTPEINNPYYVDNDLPWTVSLNAGAMPNATFSPGSSSGCWIDGAQTLCFGTNSFGQIGWGMVQQPTTHPQAVMNLADATALSRGPGNHRCAITTNRVVKCWGANGYNQAGVNDGVDKYAPVAVQAPNQYDSVATGLNHTCALDGSAIFCWGNNDQYQRSAIASVNSLPPASIVAPMGESMPAWMQLATGEFHTCAISTVGVLYCWGASRWGQVGAGAASEAAATRVIDGMP